ncbi:hypothetical protein EVAR_72594_1 [Eumeta japonica]|uniref:Uncharacterized protein n=1 Tax=Eumeta variegata TaxID=151549 RepID=A0A4C1SRK1_EUMVA|nr:hypothetical protein EVAR_72594_1 [Eumeta japonica]
MSHHDHHDATLQTSVGKELRESHLAEQGTAPPTSSGSRFSSIGSISHGLIYSYSPLSQRTRKHIKAESGNSAIKHGVIRSAPSTSRHQSCNEIYLQLPSFCCITAKSYVCLKTRKSNTSGIS